jgi:hypothetical protein
MTKIAKLAAQWAFGRPSLYGIPASLPFLGLGETTYKEPWEPRGMSTGPAAALLVNWEPSKREEEARRGEVVEALSLAGRARPELHPAGVPGQLRMPVLSPRETAGGPSHRDGLGPAYPDVLGSLSDVQERSAKNKRFYGAERLVSELETYPTHRWSHTRPFK